MRKTYKRLPLCEKLSDNLRGFTNYKDGYIATAFPEKKLYFLNRDFTINKEIETEKFYGSLFYCEEKDQILCGCYSSLCCELHILAPDGSIEEKIDTYAIMPKEYKDKEHFPSFCTCVFCHNRNYYFSLQNSADLYCIDWEGKLTKIISLQQFFEKPTVLLSAAVHKHKLYFVVTSNEKLFFLSSTLDQKQLTVMPLPHIKEKDIYSLAFQDHMLLGAVGKIKESYISELITLK